MYLTLNRVVGQIARETIFIVSNISESEIRYWLNGLEIANLSPGYTKCNPFTQYDT